MANRHRGEIEARLDGRTYRLCLTLGALAELGAAFGDSDMLALAQRFEKGRLSALDAIRIIGAGLRGAGLDIDDAAVAALRTERGAAEYVEIVARLLSATFGGEGGETSNDSSRPAAKTPGKEGAGPFPATPSPGTR